MVDHLGEGMQRMINKMGIATLPAIPGDAQASILAAVGAAQA